MGKGYKTSLCYSCCFSVSVKIYQKVVFKAKIEQYKNLEKIVEKSPKHPHGRSFDSFLVVLGFSRFIYSQANNAKRIYPETPELVPGALTVHLQCAALLSGCPSSLAALGTHCRGCVSPSNSGLRGLVESHLAERVLASDETQHEQSP